MGSLPINVVGWYSKNNLGDESYKAAIPELFPNHSFVFADAPVNKNAITVLGGGDIVTADNLSALRSCNARRLVLSVTVSQPHAKTSYDGIDTILVRDGQSHAHLKQLGIKSIIAPDFAIALKGDGKRGRSIVSKYYQDEGLELYTKFVVVVLNGYLVKDMSLRQATSFEKLSYDLADLADTTCASFLFLPFGTSMPYDDRIPNAWCNIRTKFWKKNYAIHHRLNVQDTMDIFSSADAVVSTRLHSSIFAIAAGTPFIDLTHNHKNSRLLESINRREWGMPLHSFDQEKCHGILKTILADTKRREETILLRSQQLKLLKDAVANVRFN